MTGCMCTVLYSGQKQPVKADVCWKPLNADQLLDRPLDVQTTCLQGQRCIWAGTAAGKGAARRGRCARCSCSGGRASRQ